MAKYTYIKLDISGYYIEFDEMFNPELYDNLGDTYQDFLDNKWVLLSDEQVAFHEEHPEANVKEVWDMEITPEPPRTLEDAKAEMIAKIDEYDSSSEVNGFLVNSEIEGWFTPEERSNYKSSIDAAKLLGISALTFFIDNVEMTVTPVQADYMLAEIQLYADQCYIVTKGHKIAVEAMETIEEVDAFPYTEGYPEKINFSYPFELEEVQE
jgi:hypothetical protein